MLGLVRPRQDVDRTAMLALGGALALWTLIWLAQINGRISVPHSHGLVVVAPLGLLGLLWLSGGRAPRLLWYAGAGAGLATVAFMTAERLPSSLLVGFAGPAVLAGTLVCRKWPAQLFAVLIAITGAYGSILAYTPLEPGKLVDLVLLCAWGVVLLELLAGRRLAHLQPQPGLILLLLFVLVQLLQAVDADLQSVALRTFRSSGWYALAMPLAVLLFGDRRARRVATRGVMLLGLAVAAYAVLRYVIGASPDEILLARRERYNFTDDKLLLIGSFPSRHALSAFLGLLLPFIAAQAAVLKARWRLVALATGGLGMIAIFATESRAGLIGLIVGIATVAVVLNLAGALPGARIGRLVAIGAAVLLVGGVAVALTFDSATTNTKFTNILTPNKDASYNAHKAKWRIAIQAIGQEPLGHGVGTAGSIAQATAETVSVASLNLDNSYLKIGYEQGVIPMLLFIIAMLALFGGLITRAAGVRDPEDAALVVGACGTLASFIAILMGANYIEGLTALTAFALIGFAAAPALRRSTAR